MDTSYINTSYILTSKNYENYENHLQSVNSMSLFGINKSFTINILNYMIHKEICNLFEIIKNYISRFNLNKKLLEKFIENYNINKFSIFNNKDVKLINCMQRDNYNNIYISFIQNCSEDVITIDEIMQEFNLYENILYGNFIENIINKFRNEEINKFIRIVQKQGENYIEFIDFLNNLII